MYTEWQDLIIAAAGAVFTAALVPTVYHQFRVRACTIPLTTSVPSGIGMLFLLLAYSTLGLWVAFGTLIANLSLRLIILAQRIAYPQIKEEASS